ncbi:MAG: NADH-quinone oxidoreductase subunit M [Candidatus Omnitrophica bacterium]|nr:NADH-quinone oxidoreductase subunit M [Candidatus Omnitrophota bacterium]MBI3009876.1 NADH-quinone oxidoreductase subunit M [Candidatus Omnitrophota bacterium]
MLLTSLLACPLLGMLLILVLPKSSVRWIRGVAVVATGAALLVGLKVLGQFQPALASMQFEERASWIPQLNISYYLGIDGLSLPMVLLTVLLGFLACLASFGITQRQKEYFALYLLLEVGMLGTFLALDLFLFYIFWEIVLVPMYFLIGIWGGGRREYSAFKFFVYTLAGSLAMLLGILALYLNTQTFDLVALSGKASQLGLGLQKVLFVAFFLAFAVKVPIFPFHTWLPDAHVDAPTPISVILAGVLLKMGGYGFFRIGYPLFPEGAQWFGSAMAVLGMINIVYGAFVAMAQTDFKRLVAYSSVSHMGFVLLGLASLTSEGLHGAMLQMFNHGIITGGMFLLVGVLYDRAHTRQLDAFGGLGARVPVYAGLLIFFSLATLGLPGLSGFVGEFMAFVGAFGVWRWQTMVSIIGVVIAAAYSLRVIQQVLLGPLNERWASMPDIGPREWITVAPLVVIILVIGIWPLTLLHLQDTSLQQFIAHVTR